MTLTVSLPTELGERLRAEARRRGLSADQYTLQLLSQHLPPPDRGAKLVALLESWIQDGDAAEQKATGDYLVQSLDADRPSERRLFPPELEGVTW